MKIKTMIKQSILAVFAVLLFTAVLSVSAGAVQTEDMPDLDALIEKVTGTPVTKEDDLQHEPVWTEDWMADLPDSIRISEINMPGTHDSGAVTLAGEYLINLHGQCQDDQINRQLENGIRVFDIRLNLLKLEEEFEDEEDIPWYHLAVVHNYFPCLYDPTGLGLPDLVPLPFVQVLSWCEDFVKANPSETVVLLLSTDGGSKDLSKKRLKEVRDIYSWRNSSNHTVFQYYQAGQRVPTLGEVRGKVILMDDDNSPCPYTNYEDNYKAETDEKCVLVLDALDNSAAQFYSSRVRGSGTFSSEDFKNEDGKRGEPVVKKVNTSANRFSFDSPDTFTADSPRYVASKVNEKVEKYPFRTGLRYGWLMMDFPTEKEISNIIQSNLRIDAWMNISVDVVWEDKREHAPDEVRPGLYHEVGLTTNRGRISFVADTIRDCTLNGSTFVFRQIPIYSAADNIFTAFPASVPEGYSETYTKDSETHYTITLTPRNQAVEITLNWDMLPEHDAEPADFRYNITITPQSGESAGYTISRGSMTIRNISETETLVKAYFPGLWEKGTYDLSLELDPGSISSDYTFDPAADVVKHSDLSWEITLHPARECRPLDYTITFTGEYSEDYRPYGEEFWKGFRVQGRLGDLVRIDLPLAADITDYVFFDDTVTLRAGNVPVVDLRTGEELEWVPIIPAFDGYRIAVNGTEITCTLAKYMYPRVEWHNDAGLESLRPNSLLLWLVEDDGTETGKVIDTRDVYQQRKWAARFEPQDSSREYTVMIAPFEVPNGYTASAARETEDGLVLDCCYTGLLNISRTVIWRDNAAATGTGAELRPQGTVQLLRNGTVVQEEPLITDRITAEYNFTALPLMDMNGDEYSYTVQLSLNGGQAHRIVYDSPSIQEHDHTVFNSAAIYLYSLTPDSDDSSSGSSGGGHVKDDPTAGTNANKDFSGVSTPAQPAAPSEGNSGFTDVPAGAYYADPVNWAVEKNITNGTSAAAFSPDMTCTRAQTVTFLWRAAGCPAAENTENPFTDVAEDSYYYSAVLWAVANGITNGTSETTFSPDDTVTRSQTVTFLWRAAGEPVLNAINPFADVTGDDYFYNAVLWAVENAITNGTSETAFSPADGCTRAQIVTFLYRAQ